MSESGSSSRRIVKLLCPSVSKHCVQELVVSEDDNVDMGFISRFFGLDPAAATVKLNKHLVGRGHDFVSSSSSLTWKSLLSFFASRGFPTGSTHNDPIIVNGKLCNSGTKRRSESLNTEKWDKQITSQYYLGKRINTELEHVNIFKKIKMERNDAGICNPSNGKDGDRQTTIYNGLGLLKREASLEDNNPLKKKRIDEGNSGVCNPFNGKDGDRQPTRYNGTGLLKRKASLEDNNLLKKKMIVEGTSVNPAFSKANQVCN